MDKDNINIQEVKWKTFLEQLKELPDEFALYMEKYREAHFSDLIKLITYTFNLTNELKELTVEQQNLIIEIFKTFHNYGFYGGVSYTLDPQQEYVPKYEHIFDQQNKDKKEA